jgi:lysophospholipase L1-like esterase
MRVFGLPRKNWILPTLFAAVFAVSIAGCNSTPTTPTPPAPVPIPPPPDPDPPTLTCPAPVTASTTSTSGTTVTFSAPTVTAGKEPLTLACTPASGSTFPIGATTVACTVTDSLNRTGSCSFTVTVARTPQLTVTKFLAFGDSITAGEVSFPLTGALPQRDGTPSFRLRLVPEASYPTVLRSSLTTRYSAQVSNIVVSNEGVSGEMARDAATQARFVQALSSLRPDVVLIMHGYNDIGNPSVLTDTANAIGRLASEARNRGVRVFIANLAPSRTSGNNARPSSSVTGFNERLLPVIRGEGATLVDIYSAILPDVNTYIGIDGLHPNEAGYRKIAETFLAAIQANLEVR